jgi:hypothetical protein
MILHRWENKKNYAVVSGLILLIGLSSLFFYYRNCILVNNHKMCRISVRSVSEVESEQKYLDETIKYDNELQVVNNPSPIMGNFPQYVLAIGEGVKRYRSAPLVVDSDPDMSVRAWRYSYNARGIIEVENYLSSKKTAVIVVHPWAIDDDQGLKVPAPAGVAFQGETEKNKIYIKHTKDVVSPFIEKLRGRIGLVAYSLPESRDELRAKYYDSKKDRNDPTVIAAGKKLKEILSLFNYNAQTTPDTLVLRKNYLTYDYFNEFKGNNSEDFYNNKGYWSLPILLVNSLNFTKGDIIFYDGEGYEVIKNTLESLGIKNILLMGYNTDMCLKSTPAGYENLRKDYNVFIVGDATLATFKAFKTPAVETSAELSKISLGNFITETSWVKVIN